MQGDEARELLGLSSTSHPTPSQVKAAYKRKAWESHPDRFPANEKLSAETKFKLISEAYSCLKLELRNNMSELMAFTYLSIKHVAVGEQISYSYLALITLKLTASLQTMGKYTISLLCGVFYDDYLIFFIFRHYRYRTKGNKLRYRTKGNKLRAYKRQEKETPSYNPFLP
ncbi:hypothetical protein C5167_017208 [Papaver somniferum]|uniref:J domain-containing protein n=1 Tax=Papaver somniferum TaxID=3469 RepID=A0A4Y7IIS0_PAPSO|nr:hypothetical protein C5167_017208 [Papaver somniferum]